jgi:hypothetical protein
LDLGGEWQFRLDPDNRGKAEGWFLALTGTEPIRVSCPWEYWHPEYDGVGWYQKKIVAPGSWRDRQALVRFEAVTYYCECWLNGVYLGSHEGGFMPFEFDISAIAQLGEENVLTVRVINPPIDREIDGFRSGAPLNQSDLPTGKLAWYYNFGGIWQGVSLQSLPKQALKSVHVFPRLGNKTLLVDLTVSNLAGEADFPLRFNLFPDGSQEAVFAAEKTVHASAGVSKHRLEFPLPDLALWSPDAPAVHRLRVELADGNDAIEQTFGVREFSFEGNHCLLNGQPIILKGFLQQGMYPRTLALPTRRMAIRELLLLKRKGFNFMRIHLKPAPPWYLDLADRMGILVMHEPPIGWCANGPKTRERCLREVRDLVTRDASHPSIVFWCLFNESFHVRGFTSEKVLELTGELADAARELDPSRIIIDTSGGYDTKTLPGPDAFDPNAPNTTRAWKPWESEPTKIVDGHVYCRYPVTQKSLDSYRNLKGSGMLYFITEFGAPETPPDYARVLRGYTPGEAARPLEDWKLHHDFATSFEEKFRGSGLKMSSKEFIADVGRARAEDIRLITHAIRSNPNLAGYCFCQLADASGELFGVTDVWRRPKPLYYAFSDAVADPAIDVRIAQRVVANDEPVAIACSLTSDLAAPFEGVASLSIVDAAGRAVWKEERPVPPTRTRHVVFEGALKTGGIPGKHLLLAEFHSGGKLISEHRLEFQVLPSVVETGGTVGIRDDKGILNELFAARGWNTEIYGNNFQLKNIPVLLNINPLPTNRAFYSELYGQLQKVVGLGGSAILFGAEAHSLYRWLLPHHIRPQIGMRSCGYTTDHPVFDGLKCGGAVDYTFTDVYPEIFDNADDVKAAGGEILFGSISMNMWTRPANYYWGAALYRLPLGRGNLFICHLDLVNKAQTSSVAAHLLRNLVNYAASLIQPGGEQYLLSRCCDPLPPGALETL